MFKWQPHFKLISESEENSVPMKANIFLGTPGPFFLINKDSVNAILIKPTKMRC